MSKNFIPMKEATIVLKLLGDQTRLTMLKLMDHHTCCVCEFVEIFQVSQPSISQHIRKLRDVDLITEERRGQWVFYSINKESTYYPFIQSIIDQVPKQDHMLKELEEKGTRIICNS